MRGPSHGRLRGSGCRDAGGPPGYVFREQTRRERPGGAKRKVEIDAGTAADQNAGVRFNAAPEFRGVLFRFRQIVLAVLGLGLAAFPGFPVPAAELEPRGGTAAPALVLDALDGPRTDLAGFRGQVVLVHFFATWCEPCIEETAALNRLVDRMAGRPLSVLAVDVGEIDARVRTFLRENPAKFTVLMDRDRAAMKAWGVEGLPTTFLLDRNLAVRLAARGDVDWDRPDVNAALEDLIQSPNGTPGKPAVSN